MTTIRKIEDLEVWQEARKLSKTVYRLIEKLPKKEEYNICRHLRENARGTPANIAEGFYRHFKKERLHLLDVAKGNLGEIKSDCYLCYDNKYIAYQSLRNLIEQIHKTETMLNGLIGTISRKSNR